MLTNQDTNGARNRDLWRSIGVAGLWALTLVSPALVQAQSTAFTYQGQLKDAGVPANGNYDLSYSLWDDVAAGNLIAGPVNQPASAVTNGLFTAELDFGAAFSGAPLWLELSVNGTPLSPRQSMTSTPYCQTASYSQASNIANYAYGPWVPSGSDLYYNDGNVGIGTSTPTAKLEIVGTPGVDGIKFPDGSVQVTAPTGGTGFWSGSAADIYSNNAGKIGLGTTAPLSKLDIAATGDGAELLRLSTERPWVFKQGGAGSVAGLRLQSTVGLKQFQITAAGGTNVATFDANDASPRVGIGTTTPAGTLSVSAPTFGSLRFFDPLVGDLVFDGGSDGIFGINNIGGAAGSIDFASNFGMYVRFANSGNIGIGTSTPASKLDIAAAGAGAELLRFTTERPWIFRQIYSGPSASLQLYSTSGAKNFEITCSSGANCATFYTLDASPRVGIGTTAPVATLDVNGVTRTKSLQIIGGADIAEPFDVGGDKVSPGMVVVIDPANPGKLVPCDRAYDRKVAGIISGAGGVATGLSMGHEGTIASGQYPVALTGRVYCLADASAAPIEPGDMLTTSPRTGHAMKAADFDAARGAIIGKAMTGLQRGKTGLVLVLVNMQ